MLWGCQCITSFFTFAPLLQQLYPGLEASGAADLPTPLGGNRTWSARLPRGGEGGCAAARDPSRPVRRSVRLLVGGAGDSAARRRLQLSFTLSLPPPSPVSLQGKKKNVERGEELGEGKLGGARGETGGGRIIVEKLAKAPQPGIHRERGKGGGVGWGLGKEKESLVRKLQARMRSLV